MAMWLLKFTVNEEIKIEMIVFFLKHTTTKKKCYRTIKEETHE